MEYIGVVGVYGGPAWIRFHARSSSLSRSSAATQTPFSPLVGPTCAHPISLIIPIMLWADIPIKGEEPQATKRWKHGTRLVSSGCTRFTSLHRFNRINRRRDACASFVSRRDSRTGHVAVGIDNWSRDTGPSCPRRFERFRENTMCSKIFEIVIRNKVGNELLIQFLWSKSSWQEQPLYMFVFIQESKRISLEYILKGKFLLIISNVSVIVSNYNKEVKLSIS